eukprot:TRINITY_DN13031_c0_g1_i1.p1 TRINITY_DN13031_c0_g1~~TRINITY_DN13031_c0_g1_i1.p1  ORF type:complete len:554 (-),score=113.70 TRINITY_DN13031_c0_g1_i1:222-1883(-)
MVIVSPDAKTILLVVHADRGHFNWCLPLARALKKLGFIVELWTNGMCVNWVPSDVMDKIESSHFGDGKKLNGQVAKYKAIVGEGNSDSEGRKLLSANIVEFMGDMAMEDLWFMATGGPAGQEALAKRVQMLDVAFVCWEGTWAKHAGAAAAKVGKPHMGFAPSFLSPFRAAYAPEPIWDFDGEERVRNTKADIDEWETGYVVAFMLAKCLQGKAQNLGGHSRIGAFIEPLDSIGELGDTGLWLAKDGRVTVVSLGSQSVLDSVSAHAQADLLKGCLQASERVLVATSQLPEDADLKRALDAGKLKAEAWLPLFDVLGHENTACFISHCGANSTHEALAQGVPIVPLPFHDDQFYIAAIVEELMGYSEEEGYTPLRKNVLQGVAGSGVSAVFAAVTKGLAVPVETMSKLKKSVLEENGAVTAAELIKSKIEAAPKLKKPCFTDVVAIEPETTGLNLKLKVVRKEADCDAKTKAWNVVAGDASGVVTLRLSDSAHADICEPGKFIRVQNSRVIMVKGFMRVIIDKWGVLKAADVPLDFDVKTDNDVSASQYELAA